MFNWSKVIMAQSPTDLVDRSDYRQMGHHFLLTFPLLFFLIS